MLLPHYALEAQTSPETATTAGILATVIPTGVGFTLIAASDDADDIGLVLFAGGLTLGPAVGNWVGGLTSRGLSGFAIRTGLLFGSFGAAALICGECELGSEELGSAALVLLAGTVLTSVHATWDLANIDRAMERRAITFAIQPLVLPSTHRVGLQIHASF